MAFCCPRCGSTFFEYYSSYGYCPDCNFNTEEGFAYDKKEPIFSEEMDELTRKISKEIDQELARLWKKPTPKEQPKSFDEAQAS